MNIAERLRRAKDEIDTRGWCRHIALDSNGRVCAIGALWFASGGSVDEWDRSYATIQECIHNVILEDPAAQYLGSCLDPNLSPTPASRIWWWNDTAASAEEVKDGLEAAALKWERESDHGWGAENA